MLFPKNVSLGNVNVFDYSNVYCNTKKLNKDNTEEAVLTPRPWRLSHVAHLEYGRSHLSSWLEFYYGCPSP
jgi:hypothetical protein